MSKRILFWSERFWPTIGGVGLSAGRLLPALQERGYEFVVVTLKEYEDLPEEDEYKGIPVYRWPFWTALERGNIAKMVELRQRVAALKQEFAPDLIHINFLGASVLFHLQTLDIRPTALLVSMDSAFPEQNISGDSLAGRALRAADWVTCVCATKLAQARELVPEIGQRSSFIYKGKKVPDLPPRPLPTEEPRLLCLGRLVRSKGFDIALRAFASIVDLFPKARLVIAGDGPKHHELEQQTVDLGLQSVVDMIGWVNPDEVPALINTATLVLIPSRSEGLPNVAKEAGLMARPVVATQVDGLPEIIVHQQTGLLVKPENSSALAEAIVFLLDHPEESTQMGKSARIHVQQRFGWEQYVEAYGTLYRKLILAKAA